MACPDCGRVEGETDDCPRCEVAILVQYHEEQDALEAREAADDAREARMAYYRRFL